MKDVNFCHFIIKSNIQTSMSAPANFPLDMKCIRMNFPYTKFIKKCPINSSLKNLQNEMSCHCAQFWRYQNFPEQD